MNKENVCINREQFWNEMFRLEATIAAVRQLNHDIVAVQLEKLMNNLIKNIGHEHRGPVETEGAT